MSIADRIAQTDPADDRVAVWTTSSRTTWGQLAAIFRQQQTACERMSGQRIGLALSADALGIATLAALESAAFDVFLFDPQTPKEQRQSWYEHLTLDDLVDTTASADEGSCDTADGRRARQRDGSVTILTSGTTGMPKAVRHTWHSLARPVRSSESDSPQSWLLAFRPHLYAGLQVMLQALLNHQTLVVAPPQVAPGEVVELMTDAGVQFASATPSYWRRLLMFVPHRLVQQVPLAQITLGGEVVDQPLLDQLTRLFPEARVTHIYATTEMGRCFSVTDGRAGFPAAWLDQTTRDGVQLKLIDAQLWVRSANAMAGYDHAGESIDAGDEWDGWFPTRDMIEVQDGRAYFVGRNSDMINVGGNKVYPLTVERVIRKLPEVADVRVYGVASSITGQLVACQAVAVSGVAKDAVRQRILEHCHQSLERYECPRIVEMVDELRLNSSGKTAR